MDITRGSLDDISRPASSERSRPGSRVCTVLLPDPGRVCPASSTSLVVLNEDASNDKQNNNNPSENLMSSDESPPSEIDDSVGDLFAEENEYSELEKAIKKMEALDKILASRDTYEKEVKRKGTELHEKLCQELLQIKPNNSPEYSEEAENTRRFFDQFSSSANESIEDVDFVPVFGTQMPDKEYERHSIQVEGAGEMDPKKTATDSGLAGHEQREGMSECSQSGFSRVKKKQDFLKKNIELVSGAGDLVQMTQKEKDRLKELLKDMEDEEDDAGKSDDERDIWAIRVPAGEGYSPEPVERHQLITIDSRLQLLLPVEDFLSVRSPYTDHYVPHAQIRDAGWNSGRDTLPGEEVLQDIREKRAQERRLKEIQLQLEVLGRHQDMTCDTTVPLEEQLRTLLVECEISQSCGRGPGTGSPGYISDTEGPPSGAPRLSDSTLSELLKDSYSTSFSLLDKGASMCSS
ncbi:hypothetical protein DPEC_G00316040 [Dallia pectoralis]|uniref:Uncharacterized protein n=1 Tax=Dallia pectoralis TaxID=75939 RepID=A0ACC2FCM5_DALPE|nr:hypothetical protein DPEC_G00316040 [Dallia pectoralis]